MSVQTVSHLLDAWEGELGGNTAVALHKSIVESVNVSNYGNENSQEAQAQKRHRRMSVQTVSHLLDA